MTMFANPENRQTNTKLCNLIATLHHLDERACVVRGIELRAATRNPVVHIDPPAGFVLDGAQMAREKRGDVIRVCMVARIHDCEVRWQETYAAAKAANDA